MLTSGFCNFRLTYSNPSLFGFLVFYFLFKKTSLAGLLKLESLNIRCCKCITDLDLKAISGNCCHKSLCFFFTVISLL